MRPSHWFSAKDPSALFCALLLLLVVGHLALQARSALAPVVHEEHNWRQGDVYSVAYRYHRESFDFFHPKIDFWRGPTGIVGMEAPIYATLSHLTMFVFGEHPKAARMVNFAAFLIALFVGFPLLTSKLQGDRNRATRVICGLAAFVLSPMALFEFRQIQADGLSASLTLIAAGLFLFSAQSSRGFHFFAALGLYTLAVLAKSPALAVLPALFSLAWIRLDAGRKWAFLRASCFLGPIVLALFWLLWAKQLTADHEQLEPYFNLGFTLGEVQGNLVSTSSYIQVFGALIGTYASNWVLVPSLVAGMVLSVTAEERSSAWPFVLWLLGATAFCLCFAHRTTSHPYYALIAMVPVAWFSALGLANLIEPRTQPLSRMAAGFVLGSLLCAPWIGGPAAEGARVPGAQGPAFELTWFHEFGVRVLLAILLFSVAAVRFLPSRFFWGRPRLVWAVTLVAAAIGFFRASHDALEAFHFRSGASEWASFDERYRPVRDAVDRFTTRDDLLLVDGYSPWYLHLTRRRGFTSDPEIMNRLGLDWYLSRGARFYLHFSENPALESAREGHLPLDGQESYQLYRLVP